MSDDHEKKHDAFMSSRGTLGRMADESSTFVTDQWAPILGAFRRKLVDEGFAGYEAAAIVTAWFSNITKT